MPPPPEGITEAIKAVLYGKENVVCRRRRVRKILMGLMGIETFLGLAIILFATIGRNQGENLFQSLMTGIVCLICGCVGVVAAFKSNAVLNRSVFILQMWLISTLSTFVYVSFEDSRQSQSICSTSAGNFATGGATTCTGRVGRNYSKSAVVILTVLVCIVSSMLSLDFNDILGDFIEMFGDLEDTPEREKIAERRVEVDRIRSSSMVD